MTQAVSFLDDDFKQWIESLLLEYHVPGMSIAVVDGDNIESSGYGLAHLPDNPATADTLWYMASTTKAFSAALMGLVIEEYNADKKSSSRLSFSTTVSQILPDEFVLEDHYLTANITLEDLLSHRSGMPSYDMLIGTWMGSSDLANTTRILRHLGPPAHPFRSKMIYNNIMYGVIGRVVEKLTGKSYSTVLQEKILDRLEMQQTYPGVEIFSKAVGKGRINGHMLARGYTWNGQDNKADKGSEKDISEDPDSKTKVPGYYVPECYASINGSGPAGDLISNVKDYAKWARALLKSSSASVARQSEPSSGNVSPDSPFISSQLWNELTSPRICMLPVQEYVEDFQNAPPNPQITPRTYALGWITEPYLYPGIAKVQHGGGWPGFGSGVMLVPELNLGIVMGGNTMEAPMRIWQAIEKEIIGKKMGVAKEERRKRAEPRPKPSDFAEADLSEENEVENKDSSTQQIPSTAIPLSVKLRHPNAAQGLVLQLDGEDLDLSSHFSHPALGTLSVGVLDSSASLDIPNAHINGTKIKRGPPPKKTKAGRTLNNGFNSNSNAQAVIQASFVSKRALDFSFLIHFRGIPGPDEDYRAPNLIVCDMEQLLRRGDLSRDVLPPTKSNNIQLGHGREDDEKYPFRNEVYWTRWRLKNKGSVIVLREFDKDAHPRGLKYEVEKIGLSMGRDDLPDSEDSGLLLDEGWEKKLNWFHRVEM